jgi:1,4-alpha-glucan branching enzyme
LATAPLGYLSLVLHCHLPFVRHPEHEYFLEEDWYYEALFETYLPLLSLFEELHEKGIPFRLAMSISPTLLSMWVDPLLQKRALRHIENLISLAEKEEERVQNLPEFRPVVQMYLSKFRKYREMLVQKYGFNLVRGFKKFSDLGMIELMTCAATHCSLPLMDSCKPAVKAQVAMALTSHQAQFGKRPAGFWLPECAYQPGQDSILKEQGVQYFLVDTHGLLHATPRPQYGSFAPVICPSGVAAFARDFDSSKQVWSSKEGYPGDADYREFYRDVGYDQESSYVQSHIPSAGLQKFTGLKYYRVTGPGDFKEPYDPGQGRRKAEIHAEDFLAKKKNQARIVGKNMDRPPFILCMYDAELFGHWWYEGPDFIGFFFTKISQQEEIVLFTPSDYLKTYSHHQVSTPAFSTWGDGGYSEFWLNPTNDWIYPLLLKASQRMVDLADQIPMATGMMKRVLNQACRELLLAQASDWAFMMKTGHHRDYAIQRIQSHLSAFNQLCDQVDNRQVDPRFLETLENRDNLFPDTDYKVYQTS